MSSEDQDPAERVAALKDLVQSPGWALLTRHAADEWGEVGFGRRMRAAVTQVQPGPDRVYDLARVAEEVTATKAAMDAVLNWPFQELQRLAAPQKSRIPFAALRQGGTR